MFFQILVLCFTLFIANAKQTLTDVENKSCEENGCPAIQCLKYEFHLSNELGKQINLSDLKFEPVNGTLLNISFTLPGVDYRKIVEGPNMKRSFENNSTIAKAEKIPVPNKTLVILTKLDPRQNNSFFIHIGYDEKERERNSEQEEKIQIYNTYYEDRYSPILFTQPLKSICEKSDPSVAIIIFTVFGLIALIIIVLAICLWRKRASSNSVGSDMNPEYGTYNGAGDLVEVVDRNTGDYGDSGFEPQVVDSNPYYACT